METDQPFSLLQSNHFFVNKILSRTSSFGRSGHLSTCRLPGQIPFIWEAQPGKPKAQTTALHFPAIQSPAPELPPAPPGKKPKKKNAIMVKKNPLFGSLRRHKDIESEFSRKSDDDDEYVLSSCMSYSSRSSSSSSNGDRRRRIKFSSLAKSLVRWAF